MGKFIIKNTNTGIKFDLKAGNGEVIATSEVYTTEAASTKSASIRNLRFIWTKPANTASA